MACETCRLSAVKERQAADRSCSRADTVTSEEQPAGARGPHAWLRPDVEGQRRRQVVRRDHHRQRRHQSRLQAREQPGSPNQADEYERLQSLRRSRSTCRGSHPSIYSLDRKYPVWRDPIPSSIRLATSRKSDLEAMFRCAGRAAEGRRAGLIASVYHPSVCLCLVLIPDPRSLIHLIPDPFCMILMQMKSLAPSLATVSLTRPRVGRLSRHNAPLRGRTVSRHD